MISTRPRQILHRIRQLVLVQAQLCLGDIQVVRRRARPLLNQPASSCRRSGLGRQRRYPLLVLLHRLLQVVTRCCKASASPVSCLVSAVAWRRDWAKA